ncbi:uncharacterized protein SCDLUD_002954 [Saccharomycodes ludwigii]|uniref:uncharacterized protein n=1 Tax=Saccharomycodes ludwigii TaxID=36035 RepID=UPI001E895C4F|nr:hypothetical protein SCDLUD_002954 [Saccharomycodes ludwigii]KAH3901459.1 hypothetical protein SCDLUD_002954 [Saccharomycodes ludwigii]
MSSNTTHNTILNNIQSVNYQFKSIPLVYKKARCTNEYKIVLYDLDGNLVNQDLFVSSFEKLTGLIYNGAEEMNKDNRAKYRRKTELKLNKNKTKEGYDHDLLLRTTTMKTLKVDKRYIQKHLKDIEVKKNKASEVFYNFITKDENNNTVLLEIVSDDEDRDDAAKSGNTDLDFEYNDTKLPKRFEGEISISYDQSDPRDRELMDLISK